MGVLDGQVALVTGAGSGIGQGIAIRLAHDGAKVIVDYIGSDEGANQTVATIREAGGTAIPFQADVTKLDEIHALMEIAYSTYGGCNILVNNAGFEKKADFWDVTEEDYDKILAVNLKGPFFLTQAFVCKLKDAGKKGRIVNISSVHEDMAFPGFSTYCMSKGGMRMMMRDLAVELGPLGITINNVAPGAVKTPINDALMQDKEKMAALRKNIPLGYMGSVEDIAGLVSYLASEAASYVNGATFTIDGGLSRSYHEQ
jgi:glucose 1-dehydrogenase